MAVFHLRNNQLQLSVNSLGAELCSLISKGVELIWQGDKMVWGRHAPVLFPIVGRLKNNKFNYNGTTYEMPQHGFARDKDFVLIEKSETVLEFELTASEETLRSYPFHFSLIIRYELGPSKLKISYKVFNPDNRTLFFSIGAHPGFNCSMNDQQGVFLEFENDRLTCEKLNEGLLTGETYLMDLKNRVLELRGDLFNNDALVFKNSQINTIRLFSKSGSTKFSVNCKNWPYFGIWTKKGCDQFVCLEPWYGIADSVDTSGDLIEKEGIIPLAPRQTFAAGYEIEIYQ